MPRPAAILMTCTAFCAVAVAAYAEAPRYFGYAAIECGLDDPATAATEDGYSAEVAGFTNLNMACVDADPAVTAARIRALDAIGSEVLLNVQGALFAFKGPAVVVSDARDALWPLVTEGIRLSGVPTDRIILYIVDEPALRLLPAEEVSRAVQFVRQTYPGIRTMSIDALIKRYPTIPPDLSYWGFFDYGHRDPASVPAYVAALDLASATKGPGQQLVLVVDATHFWMHQDRGLGLDDMAGVARAYADLATSRSDIKAVIGYSWVGGIDDPGERGVRDMPANVGAAHRQIGLSLLTAP